MYYDSEGTAILIQDSDIGQITAVDIVQLWTENTREYSFEELEEGIKVQVTFENGPEQAEYTGSELQVLLDQMGLSCDEIAVLNFLQITTGYRELPAKWNDLVLFDGNGNYLVHDVCFHEVTVLMIAKLLHGQKTHREQHSVAALHREDLPTYWRPGISIDQELLMARAFMVINCNSVNMLSSDNSQQNLVMLGSVYIVDFGRQHNRLSTIFRSTRLRPPIPKRE